MTTFQCLAIAVICFAASKTYVIAETTVNLSNPFSDFGINNSSNYVQAQRDLEANLRPDQKRQLKYIRSNGNTYTPTSNDVALTNRYEVSNYEKSDVTFLQGMNIESSKPSQQEYKTDLEKSLRLDKDFDEISKGLFRPRTSNRHQGVVGLGAIKEEVSHGHSFKVEATPKTDPPLTSQYPVGDERSRPRRLNKENGPSSHKIVISMSEDGQNSKSEQNQKIDNNFHITNTNEGIKVHNKEDFLYPGLRTVNPIILGPKVSVDGSPVVEGGLTHANTIARGVSGFTSNVGAFSSNIQMQSGNGNWEVRSPGGLNDRLPDRTNAGGFQYDGRSNYAPGRSYLNNFETINDRRIGPTVGYINPLIPRVGLDTNSFTNAAVGGSNLPRVHLDRSPSYGVILNQGNRGFQGGLNDEVNYVRTNNGISQIDGTIYPRVHLDRSPSYEGILTQGNKGIESGLNEGVQLDVQGGASYPRVHLDRSTSHGVFLSQGNDGFQGRLNGANIRQNNGISQLDAQGGASFPRVHLDRTPSHGVILTQGNGGFQGGLNDEANVRLNNGISQLDVLGAANLPRVHLDRTPSHGVRLNNGMSQLDGQNIYSSGYPPSGYASGVGISSSRRIDPTFENHQTPLVAIGQNTASSINADVGLNLPRVQLNPSLSVGGLLGQVGSTLGATVLAVPANSQGNVELNLGPNRSLDPRLYEKPNNAVLILDQNHGYPQDYVRPYLRRVETISPSINVPIIDIQKPPMINVDTGSAVNADVSATVGSSILPKLDLSSTVGGLLGGVGSLLGGLGLGTTNSGGRSSQNGLLDLGVSLGLGNGNGREWNNANGLSRPSYENDNQRGRGLDLGLGSALGLGLG